MAIRPYRFFIYTTAIDAAKSHCGSNDFADDLSLEMFQYITRYHHSDKEPVQRIEPHKPEEVRDKHQHNERKTDNSKHIPFLNLLLCLPPDMAGIGIGWEGMHPDGNAEPEEEIRHETPVVEERIGKRCRERNNKAQNCIDNEWPGGDQDGRSEIVDRSVKYIALHIEIELEIADLIHRHSPETAEQVVSRLVQDNAGKCCYGNKNAGNDHGVVPS
jgi:hypothetical protein